jgi:hypothetical protein
MLASHVGFQRARAELAAIVKRNPMCYKQETYSV